MRVPQSSETMSRTLCDRVSSLKSICRHSLFWPHCWRIQATSTAIFSRTTLSKSARSCTEISPSPGAREHGGFFRPLFILSYIVDSRIWHDRPFGFHLTNVLLHALNSLLVFKLGLRLFQDLKLPAKSLKAATGAAAVLFLRAPFAYGSSDLDFRASRSPGDALLSGSVVVLLRFRKAQRRIALLVLRSWLGAMALLAKESAICLPFLILIVGTLLFARKKSARGVLARLW